MEVKKMSAVLVIMMFSLFTLGGMLVRKVRTN